VSKKKEDTQTSSLLYRHEYLWPWSLPEMKEPIHEAWQAALQSGRGEQQGSHNRYQKQLVFWWYPSAPRDLGKGSSHGRILQWMHVMVVSNKACTTRATATFHSTHIFMSTRSNTKNLFDIKHPDVFIVL